MLSYLAEVDKSFLNRIKMMLLNGLVLSVLLTCLPSSEAVTSAAGGFGEPNPSYFFGRAMQEFEGLDALKGFEYSKETLEGIRLGCRGDVQGQQKSVRSLFIEDLDGERSLTGLSPTVARFQNVSDMVEVKRILFKEFPETCLRTLLSAGPCPPGNQGPKGQPGLPGRRGAPGQAGCSGLPGIDGQPGKPGQNGRPGHQGPKGPPGDKGQAGCAGPPGPEGPRGPSGNNGLDGRDGQNGVAGNDGLDGAPGIDGANGTPGKDGDIGDPGDAGLNGVAGESGLPGSEGNAGKDGIPGINGSDGHDGDAGIAGSDGICACDLPCAVDPHPEPHA